MPSAPPKGTKGETAVTTRAVGAHQLHLQDGALRAAIACNECHVVPTTVAHANGTVDLSFGTLATTGGVSPAWSGTTCSNVYCHGNFQGGNAAYAPNWTSPAVTACGTCHGVPPAAPHTQSTDCGSCHTGYTSTSVNLASHVNGRVDVATLSCTSCHGDATRATTTANPELSAAPPKDSKGNTSPTARGVGAHQLRLQDGALRAAIACTECHVLPTSVAHADGTVGLSFGTLARTGSVTPTWNGTTCSNVYCHGSFSGGNATYAPTWTAPAATACGTCHGVPPSAPHAQSTDCGSCHSGYTSTSVNLALHVNGVIDVSNLSCTSCHGDSTRVATTLNPQLPAAPPKDSRGNTATTARGVGAHQLHLVAGPFSSGISCGECHTPVTSTAHSNGVVDVAFGTLARTGGVTPSWNGTGCAASYCHGNFRNGNGAYIPTWTAPAAAACGSCHGLPPGGTHPASTACETCHTGYTSSSVNLALHVNGVIDISSLTCTSCHGSAARVGVAGSDVNQGAAPPVDTHGATTGVLVGTHVAHVNPAVSGAVYKPVACTECHPNNTSGAHSNGVVNMTFATATGANLGAFSPTFVQGNGTTTQTTCATYCHGSSLNATTTRGSVTAWSWNGAAADCGSCHKSPPGTANHHNAAALTTCSKCHGGTVNASGVVNVAGGLHVNGAIDTSTLTCSTCHGNATLAASGLQDPNVAAAPTGAGAPDTFGNTAVATANGVGVHASHVLGSRSKPVLCNACHTVPGTQIHKTGVVTAGTVVLANLSTTGAIANATYAGAGGTCSNTYCHGNLGGGIGAANVTPTWKTSATLVCNSCHGVPPSSTSTGRFHPNRTDCGACHTGYTGTTVNAATHVNGVVDYVAQTCTSCHGDPARTGIDAAGIAFSSAPPADATGLLTGGTKIGAHAGHLYTGAAGGPAFSKQVACSECHSAAIPTNPLHANGQPNVAFGTLAKTGTVTPSYASGTCSNTYCHGNFQNGAGANPITWTTASITCNSCHGTPPGGTHPAGSTLATCGNCHGNYSNATQSIINPAGHVDGSIDLSNMSCTSCHGTGGRVSVAGADVNQASSPPLDSLGASAGVRVGTHVSHVNPAVAGAVYKPVACAECHPNNTTNSHSNGVVNVTFATATGANLGAFSPTFVQGNGTTTQTTCATYCHGSSLNATTTRGSVTAWSWNGAAADCGSCHKSPPGTANHHNAAALTTCVSCHAGTVDAAGAVLVAGGLHVNGTINTSTLTCTTCHGNKTLTPSGTQDANLAAAPTGTGAPDTFGNTAVATANGVGVHAAHVLGTRSKPVLCNACHTVPGTQIHKTGVVTAGTVVLANLSTTGAIANATYAGAGGTCSNVYCHGNFAGGAGAVATATWKTAGTLACTACHGNPPALSASTHHPSNTNCAACHGTGYTASTVVAATHVDGTVNVSRTGCTLCHGDLTQTAVAATSGASAPGFNATAADTAGNTAATFAAVGAHAAHLTGTRWRSTALACSECHTVPAAGDVAHATGVGTGGARATITFGTLAKTGAITTATYAGSTTASGTNGAGTCSNVYCHGNFKNGLTTAAPSWLGGTAAAACGSCHGLPPGGTHPSNPACENCHTGYTVSTVNPANHLNGAVEVANLTCTSCHGTTGRASVAGADANQAAAPPNDTKGSASSVLVGAHLAHVNPAANGATYRAIACVECHPNNAGNTTHSNGTVDVTFTAATGANLGSYTATRVQGNGTSTPTTCATYCHGATMAAGYTGSVGLNWAWNGAAATCGSCHGFPPSVSHTGVSGVATDCNRCHPDTVNVDGSINVAGGKHINGQLDGGGEPATGGTSCGGCHTAYFTAMTASPSGKVSRHGLGSDVPLDGAFTWSGATLGVTVPLANRTCISMCHGDHPHTLTSPASALHDNNVYFDATTQASRGAASATRIGSGGGTQNRARTDFDSTAGAGVGAGLCASCHQYPLVASGITVSAATFGASAHDFATNVVGATTYTWSYGLHDASGFARNCTKCHASRVEGNTPTSSTTTSVHFSDTDPNLLAGATRPAGTASGFACYNCHGSTSTPAAGVQGNRSGKDIQSLIAKGAVAGGSGHPANADNVHDSAAEFTNATFGNALGVAAGTGQRHASCMDCHDPHEAKAGTHVQGTAFAGPPLQGAWGAQLSTNPAFWTAPTTANFTKKTIVAGTDLEATLCFKCHTGYYWGTGTPPTSPSGAFAETDVAKEFNPANVGNYATTGTASWQTGETAGSFHPVLASAGNNLGVTDNIKAPWTKTSLMTCSDCHESDTTTDASGPHGSAARFILKGPNTFWDSTTATASTGMPANTFCINCHNQNFTGSRFAPNTNNLPDGHVKSNHRVTCFSCHAAIPHGAPRPGLLNAAGGVASAVPASVAGYDGVAPYFQGGASNRLFLKSYPATAATKWEQANCGCNGTGH